MYVPWELNPQPFALLTQGSTTEPQEDISWLPSSNHKIQFARHETLTLHPILANLHCIQGKYLF